MPENTLLVAVNAEAEGVVDARDVLFQVIELLHLFELLDGELLHVNRLKRIDGLRVINGLHLGVYVLRVI